jgi:predicted dehydrogenase
MKKLRIGILGCADFATRAFIPNIKNNDQFELIAIASRTVAAAKTVAEKFNILPVHGYENLIGREDIDCVYIPLPVGLHYEWIVKSLQQGKHVLAEKSFTENHAQTKEIIDLAESKKRCVFEDFSFVYHSQFNTVFQMIESGEIGSVRMIRSSFGFPEFRKEDNIRYQKNIGGGALLDAGAYTLKAASFFLGPHLEIIGSDLNKLNNEVDYQGSILLKNKKGIVAQLSFGFDNYYQNMIEIWGSKGKITLTRAFTPRENFMPVMIIEKQNIKTEMVLPADNQLQKLLSDFYQAVQSDYSREFENILLQSKLLTEVRNHA